MLNLCACPYVYSDPRSPQVESQPPERVCYFTVLKLLDIRPDEKMEETFDLIPELIAHGATDCIVQWESLTRVPFGRNFRSPVHFKMRLIFDWTDTTKNINFEANEKLPQFDRICEISGKADDLGWEVDEHGETNTFEFRYVDETRKIDALAILAARFPDYPENAAIPSLPSRSPPLVVTSLEDLDAAVKSHGKPL